MEQTLPEQTQDETLTVPETESESKIETVATDSAATDSAAAPDAMLDITIGDMETDLPSRSNDDAENVVAEEVPSATDAELSSEDEEEMEIPWGEIDLSGESDQAPEDAVEASTIRGLTEPLPSVEGETAEVQEATLPLRRVWYVVHCYSGYENKVKKGLEQRINSMNLQDRIFRVVVPVEREVEIREGQRKNIERRVFPGYILIEMLELVEGIPSSDEVWYAVRNTPGVTGFVSSGDLQRPVPLRQEEVDKILKRMESEEPKVHVTFRVGQTVHIIDGPFADFRGNVDAVDMTKGKVRVLVSFFGRETPVELDLLQVEKV